MEKKICFFDLDGTLYDENSMMPKSARQALLKCKEKGHLIYLCTGRSLCELDEELLSIGFDGMIVASGATIIQGKEIIYENVFKEEELKELLSYLDSNDFDYYLESNQAIYVTNNMKLFLQSLFGDIEFIQMMKDIEKMNVRHINKVNFVSKKYSMDTLLEMWKDSYYVVRSSWLDSFEAGELSIKGNTKGSAIQFLLEHLHMDKNNAFGFGDSMNDLEMFKNVGISIAMGNAKEDIKEQADFVTKSVEEDGIYYALEHFQII